MTEATAVPPICHGCGRPILSALSVWVGGKTYHNACSPEPSGCRYTGHTETYRDCGVASLWWDTDESCSRWNVRQASINTALQEQAQRVASRPPRQRREGGE